MFAIFPSRFITVWCGTTVAVTRTRHPGSFLFSSSSFCTSFWLLPRAQRLLTKLPLRNRSCRAIRVKPFKLEFIYATALRSACANSAALYVPSWTHNSQPTFARFEFILSIPLHDQIVREIALKSAIFMILNDNVIYFFNTVLFYYFIILRQDI